MPTAIQPESTHPQNNDRFFPQCDQIALAMDCRYRWAMSTLLLLSLNFKTIESDNLQGLLHDAYKRSTDRQLTAKPSYWRMRGE